MPHTSAHREEASSHLTPMGQRLFRFVEFDDNEQLLAEIRKHPVGLVFTIATGLFVSLAVMVGLVVLALNLESIGFSLDNTLIRDVLVGLALVFGAFGLIATFIAAVLYLSNVVFVTDQKIAQVMYISLFNRKILQLGMGNVQDVNVSQKGILAHIFDYGSLIIETAGEMENPAFTYVPDPSTNSQIIIQAHQEYVEKHGN
ncbi:hypothetical protein A3D14_03340 [Candidatus Saccharibacteria bacterium RIFCSPHIGHO2_02_FULL_47_12]|nr:MAG: hypothetical protein A3D14_03340 [Candidatus Saccharibacteria bacterium RIFCSPHIGHO2_02_FULL_47_12]